MNRPLIIFTLASLLFTIFPLTAHAQEELIKSFNTTMKVNSDATVTVLEEIYYYFPVLRHGIYRYIPYSKTNDAGEPVKMTFDDIDVRDEALRTYKYTKGMENKNLYLKIGDPNKQIMGGHLYKISYKVSGALTYFDDHDELYWNVTGDGWDIPIERSSATINLPFDVTQNPVDVICYTGNYGSTEKNCTYAVDTSSNSVTLSTTDRLSSSEGFTVAVAFPKGLVPVLEPIPDKPSILQQVGTYALYGLIGVGLIIWEIFVPIKVYKKWKKNHKLAKDSQIVAAWFDPPKDFGGNDLWPAETSVLVDFNVDHKDVSATIIKLAQEGYLKIIEDGKKKFKLRILDNTKTPDAAEKFLLEKLIAESENGEVVLKELSKSRHFGLAISDFQTEVSKQLVDKGLFKEDPHKNYIKYMVLGILGLSTFNIQLFVISMLWGRKSAEKTPLGVDQYGKAVSLLNFLKSQESQLEFQADKQLLFEKLLPYATAFGVEDVWAKRFEDMQFTQPDWYEGSNYKSAFAYSAFSHSMTSSSTASVRTASSTSSSGFSGGSSGGGGGGGGGGSW